ncbi:MAG TPA: hypothetical protein VFE09_06755 [Rubrobacteraceae bacterium]|nr:hypothetical protein [Rubrobacteraceae bacterium]
MLWGSGSVRPPWLSPWAARSRRRHVRLITRLEGIRRRIQIHIARHGRYLPGARRSVRRPWLSQWGAGSRRRNIGLSPRLERLRRRAGLDIAWHGRDLMDARRSVRRPWLSQWGARSRRRQIGLRPGLEGLRRRAGFDIAWHGRYLLGARSGDGLVTEPSRSASCGCSAHSGGGPAQTILQAGDEAIDHLALSLGNIGKDLRTVLVTLPNRIFLVEPVAVSGVELDAKRMHEVVDGVAHRTFDQTSSDRIDRHLLAPFGSWCAPLVGCAFLFHTLTL